MAQPNWASLVRVDVQVSPSARRGGRWRRTSSWGCRSRGEVRRCSRCWPTTWMTLATSTWSPVPLRSAGPAGPAPPACSAAAWRSSARPSRPGRPRGRRRKATSSSTWNGLLPAWRDAAGRLGGRAVDVLAVAKARSSLGGQRLRRPRLEAQACRVRGCRAGSGGSASTAGGDHREHRQVAGVRAMYSSRAMDGGSIQWQSSKTSSSGPSAACCRRRSRSSERSNSTRACGSSERVRLLSGMAMPSTGASSGARSAQSGPYAAIRPASWARRWSGVDAGSTASRPRKMGRQTR